MTNIAGKYITNLSGDAEYKSFYPSSLPPNSIEMDDEMISLLISANKHIVFLDSITSQIPSMKLFISMYVRKEALMSSQIEGTQATLEDILDPSLDKNTNIDVSDVVNYLKAVEYAIDRLNTLPLCNRLIKETHEILMNNTRGQNKTPGEFRHSQNWIGGPGCTLKEARYIPPNPIDMQECISDLEKYMNSEDNLDFLIQTALIHYQFETIHPFLDGNGRMGRLLIILFLIEKKVLSSPVLYISYYLKKNRVEYYDRMSEVRTKGNYEQWIKFFLRALDESAKDAIESINKLKELHDKNISSIKQTIKHPSNTIRIFEYLEKNPIIDIAKTANSLDLSFNTVSACINNLTKLSIISKTNTANRNRTFSYTEYLNILRDGTL